MRVRAGSVSLARQQRGPDRPAGHRFLSHLLNRDARQRASRGSEASSEVASTWNFNSGQERKPYPTRDRELCRGKRRKLARLAPTFHVCAQPARMSYSRRPSIRAVMISCSQSQHMPGCEPAKPLQR
jgi:hypothetical protein